METISKLREKHNQILGELSEVTERIWDYEILVLVGTKYIDGSSVLSKLESDALNRAVDAGRVIRNAQRYKLTDSGRDYRDKVSGVSPRIIAEMKEAEKQDALYQIYTDGACSPNPGNGGWGVIVVDDKGIIVNDASGGEVDTTNQRMEITAAIEGLKMAPDNSSVWLWSDSQYVVNTMEKGWKRSANKDLWALLDEQRKRVNVTFRWLKGHDGNRFNHLADQKAILGRESLNARP